MLKAKIRIVFLAIFIFYSSFTFAAGYINKITLSGNKRVEDSTIHNYLNLKIGDEFSEIKQDNAVKNLYSTGLFKDINIEFISGNLIVKVVEQHLVSKVEFKGNSKIKSNVLSRELLTQAGESLSIANLQLDIEKIKELYKRSGRFSAIVTSKSEMQENDRVKVIFEIVEGPKTGIKDIYFIGNENYRNDELKTIILTKESKWFRFLETNDTYDPDRIDYDKELLKEFYQSVGFADFRVISATAELSKTKEYFTVTYSLEEGEKYRFGDVTIDNKLQAIDTNQLMSFVSVKAGQIFNIKSLDKIAENMTRYLASAGYPQISVSSDITDKKANIVNVKFIVDKVDKIFIGKIDIEGNLKTQDRVIRRELRIEEGDAFNRSYIEKGEQNLRNLDYFEKINTNIVPSNKKDKYHILTKVEEKSTASIGFDVGYNTSGGAFGRLSFIERNLVGTGKYLTGGVQIAKKSTSYYAGLTEPHFLDKDLSLSGNLFKNHTGRSGGFAQAEQNYTLKSAGMKTSLGYDIAENLSHEVDYLIKQDDLNAFETTSSRFLVEQIGKSTTSAIGQTLTYDKSDSRIIPKNGYVLSVSQEYAGIGGNNKYLKHELDAKYFKSFYNNNLTMKIAGSTGDIRGMGGKTIRISDRFNLGDYTLRGFSFGGIGPRDKKTKEGLGGQRYYSFTTELTFPLGLPKEFNVSGLVFADVGSVWGVKLNSKSLYKADEFYSEKSLRSSVGFGVIWITRIAPIRMDWAVPIKKKIYDDKQHFHIKFSTHF